MHAKKRGRKKNAASKTTVCTTVAPQDQSNHCIFCLSGGTKGAKCYGKARKAQRKLSQQQAAQQAAAVVATPCSPPLKRVRTATHSASGVDPEEARRKAGVRDQGTGSRRLTVKVEQLQTRTPLGAVDNLPRMNLQSLPGFHMQQSIGISSLLGGGGYNSSGMLLEGMASCSSQSENSSLQPSSNLGNRSSTSLQSINAILNAPTWSGDSSAPMVLAAEPVPPAAPVSLAIAAPTDPHIQELAQRIVADHEEQKKKDARKIKSTTKKSKQAQQLRGAIEGGNVVLKAAVDEKDKRRQRSKAQKLEESALTIANGNENDAAFLLTQMQRRPLAQNIQQTETEQQSANKTKSEKIDEVSTQTFMKNIREQNTNLGTSASGSAYQIKSAMLQIGGKNIGANSFARITGCGKTAARSARRRREKIEKWQKATKSSAAVVARGTTLVQKARYQNKIDTTKASEFIARKSREAPGKTKRVKIKCWACSLGEQEVEVAIFDKSGEYKAINDAQNMGVRTEEGGYSYMQHTLHYKFDLIRELHEEYQESGDGPPMCLEVFRQAWPYYVVDAGPNECVCPICSARTSARECFRARMEEVHKRSGCSEKCDEAGCYVMTQDSSTEKSTLLCAAVERPELQVDGGAVPKLYKAACYHGKDCPDCKWDSDTTMRTKMPPLPPCWAQYNHETIKWEEMRYESESNDRTPVATTSSTSTSSSSTSTSTSTSTSSSSTSTTSTSSSSTSTRTSTSSNNDSSSNSSSNDVSTIRGDEADDESEDDAEDEDDVDDSFDSCCFGRAPPARKTEPKKQKKTSRKRVPTTVTGTQQELFDYYCTILEPGLAHSCCCNWTTTVMKRKYAKRQDDEMIVETDFSADLEMRPADACCATFYNNVSLVPYVIHYTDAENVRQVDCIVVCSDDRAKNFAVHRHCFEEIITDYISRLSNVRDMRSVVVVTDNCAKQYRNRHMYGYVADFCRNTKLKTTHNITLTHFFLEKYHGKGTSDGICGLFKVLVRKQAWFKDSMLSRKDIMYSSKEVAEYGNNSFCQNKTDLSGEVTKRRGAINLFKFEHVGDADVDHDGLFQYKTQPLLTDSYCSQIWSNCDYDFGALYMRHGICACNPCNDGHYFDCLLPEETGEVHKWQLEPEKEDHKNHRQKEHFEAHIDFLKACDPKRPLIYPLKLQGDTEENQRPYYFHVAVPCSPTSIQPAQPAAATAATAATATATTTTTTSTTSASARVLRIRTARHSSGSASVSVSVSASASSRSRSSSSSSSVDDPPPTPSDWPSHLYWWYSSEDSGWRPAVHVQWYKWERSDEVSEAVELTKISTNRVCWALKVPPVAFPEGGAWIEPIQESNKVMMPPGAILFVRRMNLKRYQFRSDLY